MERFFNFFGKYMYYPIIFTCYGAAIFYIGGINNEGWVHVAGADNNLALGIFVIALRLIVTVYICTKVAFLVFELLYPDPGRYERHDVWFYLVNFALGVYMTELAFIDILLHGI